MANVRISALTSGNPLVDTDSLPLDRAAGTRRVTWAQLKATLVTYLLTLFLADADFPGAWPSDLAKTNPGVYAERRCNESASGSPGAANDSTQGYSIGSRWHDTDAGVPGPAVWYCVDAKPAAAIWVRCLRPSESINVWLSYPMISPAAIAGATNDWLPTGIGGAGTIRVDLSAAAVLSSIGAPTEGRLLLLQTLNSAFTLTILHDDGATGTNVNRIRCPEERDLVLGKNSCALLRYDGSELRWRVIAHSGAPSFPAPLTQSTNALTLTNAHNGRTIYVTYAGTCTITVPDTLLPGFSCTVQPVDAAAVVTWAASGTQALFAADSYLTCNKRYAITGVIVRSSTHTAVSGTNA